VEPGTVPPQTCHTGVYGLAVSRSPVKAPRSVLFVGDYQPGDPLDHRTDAMRYRNARSHLSR
jgi:hypothetical protein